MPKHPHELSPEAIELLEHGIHQATEVIVQGNTIRQMGDWTPIDEAWLNVVRIERAQMREFVYQHQCLVN